MVQVRVWSRFRWGERKIFAAGAVGHAEGGVQQAPVHSQGLLPNGPKLAENGLVAQVSGIDLAGRGTFQLGGLVGGDGRGKRLEAAQRSQTLGQHGHNAGNVLLAKFIKGILGAASAIEDPDHKARAAAKTRGAEADPGAGDGPAPPGILHSQNGGVGEMGGKSGNQLLQGRFDGIER